MTTRREFLASSAALAASSILPAMAGEEKFMAVRLKGNWIGAEVETFELSKAKAAELGLSA